MNSARALVVDDETPARRRVKEFLCDIPGVELIGECDDGSEAVRLIRARSPDLLFLDVQMPKMSGFDVLREVGVGLVPAIIFVTAYDRFALQAFEFHALDYLLKPFDRERFRQAIERARTQIENAHAGEFNRRLRGLIESLDGGSERYLDRVTVRHTERIIFVPVNEIDWIEAANDCAALHVGEKTYMIRESLNRLGRQLDPARFVRIHRSTIVNVERVKEMIPLFCGDQTLVLRDGAKLSLSRTHRDELLSRIQRR